jgi:hypothetical protein
MKLTIFSDGTPGGVYVVNSDTGEQLDGVLAIEWRADPGRMLPIARITLRGVTVALLDQEAQIIPHTSIPADPHTEESHDHLTERAASHGDQNADQT